MKKIDYHPYEPSFILQQVVSLGQNEHPSGQTTLFDFSDSGLHSIGFMSISVCLMVIASVFCE